MVLNQKTATANPVDETSHRLACALHALCGEMPPADWVDLWRADEQVDGEDPLLAWVSDRMAGRNLGNWVSPFQLLNAASVLAESPMRPARGRAESVAQDASGALARALDDLSARRLARRADRVGTR